MKIDELLANSLYEIFTEQKVEEILTNPNRSWLSFVIIPFFLLLKITTVSLLLDFGFFLFRKDVRFKNLVTIVIYSEFIFIIVIIVSIFWFFYIKTDYTLEDIQYFYPLSALSLIGYEEIEPWFIYPLQVLNLFEIAYWFTLAYLISKELNDTVSTIGLQIVASSYGIGLLIWVITIMFLTLSIS